MKLTKDYLLSILGRPDANDTEWTLAAVREVDIVWRRFVRREALRAIADTWGVSPERIRQQEARALNKLRHRSRRLRMVEAGVFDDTPALAAAVYGDGWEEKLAADRSDLRTG